MKARKGRTFLMSAAASIALLALILIIGTALADEPDLGAMGSTPTTNSFTYQGYFEDGGSPANGAYDFRFLVFDDQVAGAQVGTTETVDDLAVADGIFTVYIQPGSLVEVFNGGPRWLQVEVRPGSSSGAYSILPRQPITPVPYAWGLRPGVQLVGEPPSAGGAVLSVGMAGTYPLAMAISGSTAIGAAVRGYAAGGQGLYGTSDTGYAVYGLNSGSEQGKGYGGYFSSDTGVGVYGYSSATAVTGNVYTPGVYGRSANGVGVLGVADEATSGMGGRFEGNTGVYGEGETYGVRGYSADSYGVYGSSGEYGSGVWGRNTSSAGGIGVYGSNDGNGPGVSGVSSSGPGVYGYSSSGPSLKGNGPANLIELWDSAPSNLRFRVDNSGNVTADGTYDTPASDFAEMLPAVEGLEPGDVLAVDGEGRLVRSSEAYQTTVLGVYSTEPGFLGGAGKENGEILAPLAVVGVVPVKASAENGGILPGDLLVSASIAGHAMKAGDSPPQGTVIGKALQSLEGGTGTILMLVILQ